MKCAQITCFNHILIVNCLLKPNSRCLVFVWIDLNLVYSVLEGLVQSRSTYLSGGVDFAVGRDVYVDDDDVAVTERSENCKPHKFERLLSMACDNIFPLVTYAMCTETFLNCSERPQSRRRMRLGKPIILRL